MIRTAAGSARLQRAKPGTTKRNARIAALASVSRAMGHIRARNIGKAYRRYPHKWGRLAEWMGGRDRHELKWVLTDLTFDVAPGEAVGIIGFNGAGKSTLLKIVSGTTQPTTGNVDVGGRVAALLELGIGF